MNRCFIFSTILTKHSGSRPFVLFLVFREGKSQLETTDQLWPLIILYNLFGDPQVFELIFSAAVNWFTLAVFLKRFIILEEEIRLWKHRRESIGESIYIVIRTIKKRRVCRDRCRKRGFLYFSGSMDRKRRPYFICRWSGFERKNNLPIRGWE